MFVKVRDRQKFSEKIVIRATKRRQWWVGDGHLWQQRGQIGRLLMTRWSFGRSAPIDCTLCTTGKMDCRVWAIENARLLSGQDDVHGIDNVNTISQCFTRTVDTRHK